MAAAALNEAVKIPQHTRFYIEGCVCRSGALGCCPCAMGAATGAHACAMGGLAGTLVGLALAIWGLHSGIQMLLGSRRAWRALFLYQGRLQDARLPGTHVQRALEEQNFHFYGVGVLPAVTSATFGLGIGLHLAAWAGIALGAAGAATLLVAKAVAPFGLLAYALAQSARHCMLARRAASTLGAATTPYQEAQQKYARKIWAHHTVCTVSFASVLGATLAQMSPLGAALSPPLALVASAVTTGFAWVSTRNPRFFTHTLQSYQALPHVAEDTQALRHATITRMAAAQQECAAALSAQFTPAQRWHVWWQSIYYSACDSRANRAFARYASLPPLSDVKRAGIMVHYMRQHALAAQQLAALPLSWPQQASSLAAHRAHKLQRMRLTAWKAVNEALADLGDRDFSGIEQASYDKIRVAFLLAADLGWDAASDLPAAKRPISGHDDDIGQPDCRVFAGQPESLWLALRPELDATFARVALAPYRLSSEEDHALLVEGSAASHRAVTPTCCQC